MSKLTELESRFKSEFGGRVIAAVAGGLLTVILARLLGSDAYGLLYLSMSIFGLAGIISKAGIAASAGRYISEYKEKDPGQIHHIIKKSLFANLILILTVSFFFLIGGETLSNFLNNPELYPFLIIGSLFILGTALVKYTRLIAQGFGEISISATVEAINYSGRLIFSVAIVVVGYGALGAFIGYIIAAFISASVGFTMIYFQRYKPLAKSDQMEPGLLRRILEYNIPITFTKLSGRVDNEVDTILVGFFLNPVAVGYYVISKQIVQFVTVPATALGFSISPTYGSKKATDEIGSASRMFEKSLQYTVLLYLPAAAGVFLIADQAVELVFGSEYGGAVPILQVLAIYIVLQSITKITDYPLDYLGRAKERAIANGIATTANVGLNILLIPWIGVVGAAVATVITHSFYVTVKLYVVHDELNLNLRSIFSKLAITSGIVLCMSFVVWILSHHITGLTTMLAVVTAGVLVWATLAILTGLLDIRMVLKSLT